MAVQSENVEQLMGWLADGSPARSAHTAAEPLVQRLAALVFQGDASWPNHTDRVDTYRDALSGWFANDKGGESQFADLTGPGADPGALIDWLQQFAQKSEQRAAGSETGTASDGAPPLGQQNPHGDGTPGTEYYRHDEATGQYLYAAAADSTDWATYEARRYTERAHDDNYGLDYRLDRTGQVYEWYDETTATWQDQTWADLHAAAGHDPDSTAHPADGGAQPEWDENWTMFYRVGPGGVYEFADAVTPGDKSSGCTDQWLSHEQVLARAAQGPDVTGRSQGTAAAADGDRSVAPQVALDAATEAAMEEVLAGDERFASIPEERRRELAAEVLREQAAAG